MGGQTRELKAIQRLKGFSNAPAVLRALLIHLALGCSLKETALRCRHSGIAQVSHVAVWKRLRAAGPWLHWMARGVMADWCGQTPNDVFGGPFRIRLVDGSSISEPGSTGSNWRIRYSVNLSTLYCDFVEVTEGKRGGENLTRFPVSPGDLLLGDRIYSARAGIRHVVENGGHVLLRLPYTNLPLQAPGGGDFPLLQYLRNLTVGEIGEWEAEIVPKRKQEVPIGVRVCAIKRSETAAQQARERLLRTAKRKGHQTRPETL
jgi:hypothetical protein